VRFFQSAASHITEFASFNQFAIRRISVWKKSMEKINIILGKPGAGKEHKQIF
jgi:AAA15 family ATPase/GTPase